MDRLASSASVSSFVVIIASAICFGVSSATPAIAQRDSYSFLCNRFRDIRYERPVVPPTELIDAVLTIYPGTGRWSWYTIDNDGRRSRDFEFTIKGREGNLLILQNYQGSQELFDISTNIHTELELDYSGEGRIRTRIVAQCRPIN